jgi:hypothetical protein
MTDPNSVNVLAEGYEQRIRDILLINEARLDQITELKERLQEANARLDYIAENMRSDPQMSGVHKWWRWQPYPFPTGVTFLEAVDNARLNRE